jgi:hypothetical protein
MQILDCLRTRVQHLLGDTAELRQIVDYGVLREDELVVEGLHGEVDDGYAGELQAAAFCFDHLAVY